MKDKFKLFLPICSIFLIILLFEIGLRLFNPFFRYVTRSMKIFKYSSNYLTELKPSIHRYKLYVDDRREKLTFDVNTNSHGFRGKEISPQKSLDTFRIICMGDSCTFSWGVNDDQTYPFILQKILNKDNLEQTMEVINAGIPGHDSLQGLILLKRKILSYKPDIVIAWFGPNDTGLYRMRQKTRLKNARMERIKYYLNKSCVFFLIKAGIKKIFVKMKTLTYNQRVSLDDFKKNIKEMVQIAEKNNFSILFLNTPLPSTGYKFYNPINDGVQEYNKGLRAMAKDKEIMFIDIESVFLNNNRDSLFIDTIHPNVLGYKLIAEKIAHSFFTKRILN